MTQLKPGRQRAVLDRRLRMVRLARDLGNYIERWKKKYEAYIKSLFEAQNADAYQGSGVSATYTSVPRRSLDPLAVVKDYPLKDLSERGLVSIGMEGFCDAYGLKEGDLTRYLSGEGSTKRLDITVESAAAGRFKRKLATLMRGFEANRKKKKK